MVEAELLFFLAKRVPKNGIIVEIGSYKGGSTICLAKGAKNKVYTIDYHFRPKKTKIGPELFPKNSLPYFNENIKKFGVKDKIIPLVKTSEQAAMKWHRPINLLWIDGNHGYEAVKKDFLLWEKYLVLGGIIALHDAYLEGPARVIQDYIINSKKFKKIKTVDSIFLAKKIKNKKIWTRLKNYLADFPLISLINTEKYQRLIREISCKNYQKIDRVLGQTGLWLKKRWPKLYYLIKKIKG